MKLVIDPRTKLFCLVLINVIIFVSPNLQTELICVGAVIVTILIMGAYKQALYSILAYAGMLAIVYLCGIVPQNVVSAFILMIAACFRKIAPALFFASGMIATTKVGELVSSMQKLKIPKSIVITFAVTLRFFPAVREEFSSILDAMRLRGIGLSPVNIITRPITVMESVLIPIMMRCATIAEELSAASVTRGIESDGKRTSITELKIRPADWIIMVIYVVLAVFTITGGIKL